MQCTNKRVFTAFCHKCNMKRRGSLEQLSEYIIHLVLLLLVIVPFASLSLKIKDNALHTMRVEAKDYLLARDSASISSFLDYDYEVRKNIIISVEKEKCSVKIYHENKLTPLVYSCARLTNLKEDNLNNLIKIKNV